MKINVDRSFLEINSLKDLNRSKSPGSNLKISEVDPPDYHLNKFFYKQIGRKHRWIDRLTWGDKKWIEYVENPRIKTFILKDNNNIFAKILRNEIPCNKIYEDEFVLSFYDINPQKKIHALVIPKGKYVDLDDFSQNASPEEMVGLLKGINIVAKKLNISVDTGKGYRALANISEDGGQEVPHLHFHLFGGEKIGKMVS